MPSVFYTQILFTLLFIMIIKYFAKLNAAVSHYPSFYLVICFGDSIQQKQG